MSTTQRRRAALGSQACALGLAATMTLVWASPAAAIDGCESRRVLGVSPDLSWVAVYNGMSDDEPSAAGACKEPPAIARVLLCHVAVTGDLYSNDVSCSERWEDGYPRADTGSLDKALVQAREALEAKGIELPQTLRAIPTSGLELKIPRGVLASYGLDSAASVTVGYVESAEDAEYIFDIQLTLAAPGCGSVRVRGGGTTFPNHWVEDAVVDTANRHLFFFAAHGINGVSDAPTVISLARVASRLLNARGFRSHRAKDYAAAATDYAKAFSLDPEFAQAAFNLACAKALLGDAAGALGALTSACKLEPTTFGRKARKDHDLDGVRKEPAFATLLESCK